MGKPMGIPFDCNFNSFSRRVYMRNRRICKIVVSDFHNDPFARNTHACTHTHILDQLRSFLEMREIMIALWREIMTMYFIFFVRLIYTLPI